MRAILAGSLGLLQGTRIAVIVGTITAVLIGLVGLFAFHNFLLIFLAAFVIWAGLRNFAPWNGKNASGKRRCTAQSSCGIHSSAVGSGKQNADSGIGF